MFDYDSYKNKLDALKDRAMELVRVSSTPLNMLVVLIHDKQNGTLAVASEEMKVALTASLMFNRDMHRLYSELHETIGEIYNDVIDVELDDKMHQEVGALNTLADVIESLLMTANGIDNDFKEQADELFNNYGG